MAAIAERFVTGEATVAQVHGFSVFQLEDIRSHPQTLVGAVTKNPIFALATDTEGMGPDFKGDKGRMAQGSTAKSVPTS